MSVKQLSHTEYHIKSLSISSNLEASLLSSNAFCFFVSGFQPCFTAFCRRCLSLVLLGMSANFRKRTRFVSFCWHSNVGDSRMHSSGFSLGICDRHNRFRYMSSTLADGLRCRVLAGKATGTFSEACEFTVDRRRLGRLLVMFIRLESVNITQCKYLI